MSGVSTSSAKRGWLRSTRLPALGSPRHRRIHGSAVPLGCVPPLHQSFVVGLPHPIHLSCISNPLTLGELRTASKHRFPHFHPCHRRIASVCPADGQAVPGHSEHAARLAVALDGSTTLAVRPTFLNGRLDHRSAPGGVAGGYGAGVGHGSLCKVRCVFSPDNSNSTAFICLCVRGECSASALPLRSYPPEYR